MRASLNPARSTDTRSAKPADAPSSGTLPAPLVASTVYYPIAISGSTCQLSATSGGSAITLTSTGTAGQCFVVEGPDLDADIETARQAIAMLIGGNYTHGRESQTDMELRPNAAFASLVRSLKIMDMEV